MGSTTKLVRDYEAEKQAWKDYTEDLDSFVAGKAKLPPHPGWVPSVICKEVKETEE